ncbi:hypothetical protein BDV59DRAFT_180759 [Aspergillus ambiguus]|uniref:uncharacterized protein n=1 Tax=Aspergillus ambiguus TaxID=176160 RepID=UPI003CCD26AF
MDAVLRLFPALYLTRTSRSSDTPYAEMNNPLVGTIQTVTSILVTSFRRIIATRSQSPLKSPRGLRGEKGEMGVSTKAPRWGSQVSAV